MSMYFFLSFFYLSARTPCCFFLYRSFLISVFHFSQFNLLYSSLISNPCACKYLWVSKEGPKSWILFKIWVCRFLRVFIKLFGFMWGIVLWVVLGIDILLSWISWFVQSIASCSIWLVFLSNCGITGYCSQLFSIFLPVSSFKI